MNNLRFALELARLGLSPSDYNAAVRGFLALLNAEAKELFA